MLRGLLPRRPGAPPDAGPTYPARPNGAIIWCHAPLGITQIARQGLDALRQRLRAEAETPVDIVLTGGPPMASVAPSPTNMAAFLSHWAPIAVFWLGPGDNTLAQASADCGHAPILLTLSATGPLHPAAFQRAVTGPLCPDPVVPPCNEAEAEDLSSLLRGRPVWLAVLPPPEELAVLIAAHRAASQASHRLLLFLILPNDAATDPIADLTAAGWRVAQREDGEDPNDGCEIYIIEGDEELALWYRLSPVSYLGGSLSQGCNSDPQTPAAMGSAIICGQHGGIYERPLLALDQAGALIRLTKPSDLTPAVIHLLAPDQTAQLANAGWQETTKGAPLQNVLMDLLLPLCQSPTP